jgi:hypothetical protein
MTDQKRAAGRPRKSLTDEQRSQIEGLASILSQDQIADYFGISRPTLAAIMAREPEISLLYKKGRTKGIAAVAQGLLQEARSGNMTASIFFLKTQAGWRESSVVEGPGPNGEHVVGVSDDLRQALDAIAGKIAGGGS